MYKSTSQGEKTQACPPKDTLKRFNGQALVCFQPLSLHRPTVSGLICLCIIATIHELIDTIVHDTM